MKHDWFLSQEAFDALLEWLDPDREQAAIKYEDIRKRRGGVAIARVAGGNCGACRVGIPEAVRKQAFGDGLAQCPNCERILYVG